MQGFTPEGENFFHLPDLIGDVSRNVREQARFKTWLRALNDESREWVIDVMAETNKHKEMFTEPKFPYLNGLLGFLQKRFR